METWPLQPVPVFPLPSIVLFPHVSIPLHIYELRYRTMVRDALSADRHVAMALLKPGWERDYQDSPEFHELVCLATIAEVEWLPDDCYQLRLRGLSRARVIRVEREFPYRTARLEPLPQHPYPEDDPLVRLERQAVFDAGRRMAGAMWGGIEEPAKLGLEALANVACAFAPMDTPAKFALLAEDSVIERCRQVREWIERRLQSRGAQLPEQGEGWNN
ncbi:MAG: LON peptidase substrate-binding domain-containing protein [Candidatus Eisenbacteria bacterium]